MIGIVVATSPTASSTGCGRSARPSSLPAWCRWWSLPHGGKLPDGTGRAAQLRRHAGRSSSTPCCSRAARRRQRTRCRSATQGRRAARRSTRASCLLSGVLPAREGHRRLGRRSGRARGRASDRRRAGRRDRSQRGHRDRADAGAARGAPGVGPLRGVRLGESRPRAEAPEWSGREDLNLDPFPGREACCNYTTSAKPASDEPDTFEVSTTASTLRTRGVRMSQQRRSP